VAPHVRGAATPPPEQATRRGPRPRGTVRAALVQAGVELARAGGPDAVVLREVTRRVGVAPNAAYRHFVDRAALLGAVRATALAQLAQRMVEGMRQVRAGPQTPTGARQRLRAVGRAYLEFARTEPGLFDTAFTTLGHRSLGARDEAGGSPGAGGDDAGRRQALGGRGELRPFAQLELALDGLVEAGLLARARRPVVDYPIWAAVHGLAVLLLGPLRGLPERDKARLEAQTFGFIEDSVS
jgi:AcrR family transcriptional regulator